VGVTVKENEPVESIRLKITPDLWNYIESKPIHGSQKLKNKTDDGIIVEVEVKINYEFMSLLFSYMDGIEVIIQIRKKLPDTRIIAISGGGRISADNHLKIAEKLGADAVLTKPFSTNELKNTINSLKNN
ncbi:MAG: response regulator, partial [bacterium]